MGISVLPYRYRINGVLNTGNSVLKNMEQLANSCATWISYDMFTGLWDVVINRPEEVVMSFDDNNIIGAIQLSGTGLREMYNSVEVQFPHSDLNNQMDYIRIEIPPEDRLPNEPDNTLNITYDLLNDPVQAQLLGLIELKQARMDKVITFTSDYSMIGLAAGSIISVSNNLLGFAEKLFRVISVKEVAEEGQLTSEITALEYDISIYDTSDLYRYIRTNASGIVSIGAIGTPDIPQVTKFEKDSRPRVIIEAEVPGGLVTGMEYWVTTDTTIGSDENRTYTLIDTLYSSLAQGAALTQGDTLQLDYDNAPTGNLLVKVRGINGEVTGPFSEPSGLLYQPVQVTDAVGSSTQTLDDEGDAISGLLSANALLYLLGQLMNGDTSTGTPGVGSGSLWNVFWELFNTETGQPAGTTVEDTVGGLGTAAQAGGKIQISAAAGKYTTADLAPGNAFMHSFTFVPDITAQYKVDVIFDQNTSGARGGRGSAWGEVSDSVSVGFQLQQGSTTLAGGTSGGPGAQYWTDFIVTDLVNLTAGVTYSMGFFYNINTESNPSGVHNWDISWNVYTLAVA